MEITRSDPPGINSFPGLIAQVVQPHSAELVYVSGQVACNADGEFVGTESHAEQAEQIAGNIDIILESLDAKHDSIVKETIYVTQWSPTCCRQSSDLCAATPPRHRRARSSECQPCFIPMRYSKSRSWSRCRRGDRGRAADAGAEAHAPVKSTSSSMCL